MEKVVERLNELINKENIKEVQTALKLKSVSLIYKWLDGKTKPGFKNLVGIANYFECSLDYLLGRTEFYESVTIKDLKPFKQQFKSVLKEKGVKFMELVNNGIMFKGNYTSWIINNSLPSTPTLIRLADYLGVSVDHLIGRE